jgi:hypothetical protein
LIFVKQQGSIWKLAMPHMLQINLVLSCWLHYLVAFCTSRFNVRNVFGLTLHSAGPSQRSENNWRLRFASCQMCCVLLSGTASATWSSWKPGRLFAIGWEIGKPVHRILIRHICIMSWKVTDYTVVPTINKVDRGGYIQRIRMDSDQVSEKFHQSSVRIAERSFGLHSRGRGPRRMFTASRLRNHACRSRTSATQDLL